MHLIGFTGSDIRVRCLMAGCICMLDFITSLIFCYL